MNRVSLLLFYMLLLVSPASAQQAQMGKLSPWLRQIVRKVAPSNLPQRREAAPLNPPNWGEVAAPDSAAEVTSKASPSWGRLEGAGESRRAAVIAFIRLTADGDEVLAEHGCRSLARSGDIHIAEIPLSEIPQMTLDRRVLRIEASRSNRLLTDSMAIHLNATQAYTGKGLPSIYTGRGVVMGSMDVGFDLTHPNFYSRDTTTYRIRRFWDQISQDTIGSDLPVGRDFTTREELLAVGHSRDGLDLTHGTHTLGISCGSGYDSPYRGMAPEADICMVANAVSEDLPYIDSADVYKYTFATDALGFKYIFDYAEQVGKPCVISFSEGSQQDFYGYDQLYYALLSNLTGPGRILVAAAGNDGHNLNYVHKTTDRRSAGTFMRRSAKTMDVVIKSADDFLIRLVNYDSTPDTLLLRPRLALQQPDSLLSDSAATFAAEVYAYPSSYIPEETCYDLTVSCPSKVGVSPRLSIELVGDGADIEMWRVNGHFDTFEENPRLSDAITAHYIHSPSTAPSVISVGATTYRDHIVSLAGDTMTYWMGTGGRRADFSSMGPTFDGRIKPDCVAPGNNIISSYSSFFRETHPDSNDLLWDVGVFDFNGRTYSWTSNSGTSSSAPAVGGAIALWLQACPTLSPADVLGVLQRTCRHPSAALDYPNNEYGYGEIDVYAGLLDILGLPNLDDIGEPVSVSAPAGAAAVYNLQGQRVADSLSDASLPAGLYIRQGHKVVKKK